MLSHCVNRHLLHTRPGERALPGLWHFCQCACHLDFEKKGRAWSSCGGYCPLCPQKAREAPTVAMSSDGQNGVSASWTCRAARTGVWGRIQATSSQLPELFPFCLRGVGSRPHRLEGTMAQREGVRQGQPGRGPVVSGRTQDTSVLHGRFTTKSQHLTFME